MNPNAENDLNKLATCVIEASLRWTGEAEASNPALKRARTLAGLAIHRTHSGIKWIDSGTLPLMHDDITLQSEEVLCQTGDGRICIGYVQYGIDGWDIEPSWNEGDMYQLDDVVKWVYVRDIVERIS